VAHAYPTPAEDVFQAVVPADMLTPSVVLNMILP
jgi:hypothetical protein